MKVSELLPPQDEATEPLELPAIKNLFMLLDKAFKTIRTYGPTNPVAQKFFLQFYNDLTVQLAKQGSLLFLIQRSEFYYQGQVVYRDSSSTENLAFKLYADGIRELGFHQGLSREDLSHFLEALAAAAQDTADDDIVTRLWERNLSTISFVTAEEIIKSADSASVLMPQDAQILNRSVSELHYISADTRQTKEGGQPGSLSVMAGYEVSQDELNKLAQEIAAESARDHIAYLLDMLTAILASEQSHTLLSRLLDLYSAILDTLIKQGNWKLLGTLTSLLWESQELCPHLTEQHKLQLAEVFDGLGRPERLKAIETSLNAAPDVPIEELHELLLTLKPETVQPLCALLANLEHEHHRDMVADVLCTVAKQNPLPLARSLADQRWDYVRSIVAIIGKLNNPKLAISLEPLATHPEPQVRREAVRSLGALIPSGPGEPFIRFLNDSEKAVRHAALRILTAARYEASSSAWMDVITSKHFPERPFSEKRAVFHAMARTTGDDIVPYCRELILKWFWIHRRQHQEAALLAVEALQRVGSSAALSALEAGSRRRNRAIRRACAEALAHLARQPRASQRGSRK